MAAGPSPKQAWQGWEWGRAESDLALGEAGGSYTPSLTPFPCLPRPPLTKPGPAHPEGLPGSRKAADALSPWFLRALGQPRGPQGGSS